MLLVLLSCLMLTLRLVWRGPTAFRLSTFAAIRLPRAVWFVSAAVLPFAFWAWIRLSEFQAAHDGQRVAWIRALPIPTVDDVLPWTKGLHETISSIALCCVVIMTIALGLVCLTPPSDASMRVALGVSTLAMAGLAIHAAVLTTTDVYYYVFEGGTGLAAYAPPADLFGKANVIMDRFIPLRGCIYGPLWIAINSFVLSLGQTTIAKIIALRCFNVLLIMLTALCLRGLRVSVRAQIAFLLNPMIWFYFVVNPHIDFMGILPCLLALLVAPACAWGSVLLVAAAACVKLPFLVAGIPAFVRLSNVRQTVLAIAAATTLALGISWYFGGAAYFHPLAQISAASGRNSDVVGQTIRVTLALSGFVFVIVAVLYRRLFPGAAILIAMASPIVCPWYLLSALPYAVSASQGLLVTLLALPLLAILLSAVYNLSWVSPIAFVVVVDLCLLDMYHATFGGRGARRPRADRPSVSERTGLAKP